MTINWKDIDLFIFTNLDMLMIPFSDSVWFGECTETKLQKIRSERMRGETFAFPLTSLAQTAGW